MGSELLNSLIKECKQMSLGIFIFVCVSTSLRFLGHDIAICIFS